MSSSLSIRHDKDQQQVKNHLRLTKVESANGSSPEKHQLLLNAHQNDFDKDAYSLEYVEEYGRPVDLFKAQPNAYDKISRLSQKPNGQSFGHSG